MSFQANYSPLRTPLAGFHEGASGQGRAVLAESSFELWPVWCAWLLQCPVCRSRDAGYVWDVVAGCDRCDTISCASQGMQWPRPGSLALDGASHISEMQSRE